MSKEIENASKVTWPTAEIQNRFTFDVIHEDGVFNFLFYWLNDRWNCWVTLPDGNKREAGVYPNVVSWSGYTDYGIVFYTDLPEISYSSIFIPELVILKWA